MWITSDLIIPPVTKNNNNIINLSSTNGLHRVIPSLINNVREEITTKYPALIFNYPSKVNVNGGKKHSYTHTSITNAYWKSPTPNLTYSSW